jgi:hypothetical protein
VFDFLSLTGLSCSIFYEKIKEIKCIHKIYYMLNYITLKINYYYYYVVFLDKTCGQIYRRKNKQTIN